MALNIDLLDPRAASGHGGDHRQTLAVAEIRVVHYQERLATESTMHADGENLAAAEEGERLAVCVFHENPAVARVDGHCGRCRGIDLNGASEDDLCCRHRPRIESEHELTGYETI